MVTRVCMDKEEVCKHGDANFELSIPSEMAEIPLWGKKSPDPDHVSGQPENFVPEMSPKSAHKNSKGAQRAKYQEKFAWPLNNANATSYSMPHLLRNSSSCP